MSEDTADFGYERVAADDKSRRVRAVFDSVAERYDVMNDLMSLGMHRHWKRFAVSASGVRAGARVLDLAGGTGDLARLFHKRVGSAGIVVMADINAAMLTLGRDRTVDSGVASGVGYVQADAERLPFASGSFDCVCVAFGLRNVTRKERALEAMYNVLSPGGVMLILEFSAPRVNALAPIYDAYSFQILPRLGKLIADDEHSYRYLAESIRRHPDQEALLDMMTNAGFECCTVNNLMGGIVALHRGYRV